MNAVYDGSILRQAQDEGWNKGLCWAPDGGGAGEVNAVRYDGTKKPIQRVR